MVGRVQNGTDPSSEEWLGEDEKQGSADGGMLGNRFRCYSC